MQSLTSLPNLIDHLLIIVHIEPHIQFVFRALIVREVFSEPMSSQCVSHELFKHFFAQQSPQTPIHISLNERDRVRGGIVRSERIPFGQVGDTVRRSARHWCLFRRPISQVALRASRSENTLDAVFVPHDLSIAHPPVHTALIGLGFGEEIFLQSLSSRKCVSALTGPARLSLRACASGLGGYHNSRSRDIRTAVCRVLAVHVQT